MFINVSFVESASILSTYELFSNNKDTIIQSDGVMKNEAGKILLAQKSNLKIVHTPTQDINDGYEPDISITIENPSGEDVFSVQSPKDTISGENPDEIEKFLEQNEMFSSHVGVVDSSIVVTVPVEFSAGIYVLKASFDDLILEYEFEAGSGAYTFEDVEIIAEDGRVFIKAPYVSFSPTDDVQNLMITFFDEENNILYDYEEKKTLYESGEIYHDINFDNKGLPFRIKLKLTDDKGSTLLFYSKKVSDTESPKERDLHVILIVGGLALCVLLLLFIKYFKKQIPLVILSLMFFGFSNVQAQAPKTCENKPSAYCLEGEEIDYVCQLSNGDCTKSSNDKLFFSNGVKQNTTSSLVWVGPVNTSVNICNKIGSLDNGEKFYVLSDSTGSSWTVKRYYIYNFVKGNSETIMNDTGGRKRNVNYATYDGNCTITTYSKYVGPSSDWKWAKTTIVEVGAIDSGICKSRVVNSDVFAEKGDIVNSPVCANNELQDKFIVESKYISTPPPGGSWSTKKVDICSPLGLKNQGLIDAAKGTKESFYFLLEQTGSWIYIQYPVFQFQLGVAKNLNYNFGQRKNNLTHAQYDGDCKVTFYLQYTGKSTKQWDARFNFWEVGFVKDAMCYAPDIEKTLWITTYDSIKENYYPDRAPFMIDLRKCFDEESCTLKKEWAEFSTGEICTDCYGTKIPPGDMCKSVGSFTVSCVVDPTSPPPGVSSTLKATSYNASSSVVYSWSKPLAYSQSINIDGDGPEVTIPTNLLRISGMSDSIKFNVKATDADGNVAENSCYAIIAPRCDDTYDEGQFICNESINKYDQASCIASGWQLKPTNLLCENEGKDVTVSSFKFDPDTVSDSGMCKLYLRAENVKSCSLTNRVPTIKTIAVDAGTSTIDIKGTEDYSVGTYTLNCVGTNDVSQSFGSKSCYSNSKIKEY